jgi:hypothetical protein
MSRAVIWAGTSYSLVKEVKPAKVCYYASIGSIKYLYSLPQRRLLMNYAGSALHILKVDLLESNSSPRPDRMDNLIKTFDVSSA